MAGGGEEEEWEVCIWVENLRVFDCGDNDKRRAGMAGHVLSGRAREGEAGGG